MKRYQATTSSEAHILDCIEVDLVVAGKKVGLCYAADIGVTIDFSYVPGYGATIANDPFDSEEGCPDEVDIRAVCPSLQVFLNCEETGANLVLDAGADVRAFLTDDQIIELERVVSERMSERAAEGMEP